MNVSTRSGHLDRGRLARSVPIRPQTAALDESERAPHIIELKDRCAQLAVRIEWIAKLSDRNGPKAACLRRLTMVPEQLLTDSVETRAAPQPKTSNVRRRRQTESVEL